MDGCSLNDAFPSGGVGSVGCQDRISGDESRRQEKKKARRCRGPAANYLNSGMNNVGPIDPDRPAVKPMNSVPSLNDRTGLLEHAPVTEEYDYETFVGAMDDLPAIQQSSNTIALQNQVSAPSYFGASPNERTTSKQESTLLGSFGSTNAPFVDMIGQDESYKLSPDFGTTFTMNGVQKAGGSTMPSGPSPTSQEQSYLTPSKMLPNSILPFPNVDNFWKNNPNTGGQGSFFAQLRAPGGEPSGSMVENHEVADVQSNRREVLTKLDKIFARLDDIDASKSENAQTEVLLFIMTGLGVIFLMDISCRAASMLASRR
jgi:hypothetical protein